MYLDRGVSANGKLFLVHNKKKKKEKKERNRECTARNGDTATSKNHIRRRISLQPPSGFRVRLYDRYPRPDTKRQPKQIRSYRKSDPTARLERKARPIFARTFLKRTDEETRSSFATTLRARAVLTRIIAS